MYTDMSPKKVKVALQCILIITFLTLCILSLDNLLKADTSLAFSKEDSAYFPSMTICPLRASLKALESFDDISNISIRDYLKINLVESVNKSRKIVDISGKHLQFNILPLYSDLNDTLKLRNCTTASLDLDGPVQGGSLGSHVNIEINWNPHFQYFSVVFHDKGDGRQKNQIMQEGSKLFVNIRKYKVKYIQVHMKKFVNINTDKNPCSANLEGSGYLEDLNKFYMDNMNCTLPWLAGKSETFFRFDIFFIILSFFFRKTM